MIRGLRYASVLLGEAITVYARVICFFVENIAMSTVRSLFLLYDRPRFRGGWLLVLLITLWIALVPLLVGAQGSSAGVTISPANIEEQVDPGEERTFNVRIQNLQQTEETYYVFTRNISGVRPGGVPIFARDNRESTGYELADWVTLGTTEITLAGGTSESIPVVVNVPDDASPGSHFGGIFVSVDPPQIERSGAAVGYQVANIMSLRVSGDTREEATIRQFSTDQFLYGSQDVGFTVRIENLGNTLIRPRGPLEIYNMLGEQVDKIDFNDNELAVFPGSERSFDNVRWEGDGIGFGRYEAILSTVYGGEGEKQTISSTVTFWVLPANIILPALGGFAFILLLSYLFARVYINRSLAQLQPGRRVVRRRRKSNTSLLLLTLVTVLTVTALFLIVLLALFA